MTTSCHRWIYREADTKACCAVTSDTSYPFKCQTYFSPEARYRKERSVLISAARAVPVPDCCCCATDTDMHAKIMVNAFWRTQKDETEHSSFWGQNGSVFLLELKECNAVCGTSASQKGKWKGRFSSMTKETNYKRLRERVWTGLCTQKKVQIHHWIYLIFDFLVLIHLGPEDCVQLNLMICKSLAAKKVASSVLLEPFFGISLQRWCSEYWYSVQSECTL